MLFAVVLTKVKCKPTVYFSVLLVFSSALPFLSKVRPHFSTSLDGGIAYLDLHAAVQFKYLTIQKEEAVGCKYNLMIIKMLHNLQNVK